MAFGLTPRLRSAIELVMLRGGDAAVLAPCARNDARGISLEHVRLLSRLLREEEPRPQYVWVCPIPALRARTRPDVVHAPTRLGTHSGAHVARGCHAAAACQAGEARAAPRAGTPDGAAPRSAGDPHPHLPPSPSTSHASSPAASRRADARLWAAAPCIQAAALYNQAAVPCLQASHEYAAIMGDVHGHNNDGSLDIEMASYKSQMGVRTIVAP